MKIIALSRKAGAPAPSTPAMRIFADSAIVLPGKPMFLPDFDTSWSVTYLPAIRICRLGKNIAPRFASRYFDAITVAAHITPINIVQALHAENLPQGVADIFDNSLVMGRWMELSGDDNAKKFHFFTEGVDTIIPDFPTLAAETIACVSRYATLKMGDIIMPCYLSANNTIDIGHRLHADIAPQHCAIDVVIK